MQNHYSKGIRLMAILQTMSLSNSLLKIKSDYDTSQAAIYSLISDKDLVLPDPFIKMNCISCEQPISDVIMNINTENGRIIFESFGNLMYCDSCRPEAQ